MGLIQIIQKQIITKREEKMKRTRFCQTTHDVKIIIIIIIMIII